MLWPVPSAPSFSPASRRSPRRDEPAGPSGDVTVSTVPGICPPGRVRPAARSAGSLLRMTGPAPTPRLLRTLRGRIGMRRLIRILFLSVAILAAGCMAAGCGSSVKSAISSIAPSRTSTTPGTITSTAAGPTVTTPARPSPPPARPSPPPARPSPPPPDRPTAATAQPSGSPAANGGAGSSLLWLWILLGALVLVGVIVLIVRSAGRRSATAAGWQSRIIDAYAKGSALHDAMSVAETPGALAAGDAAARWGDIQRRSDDLAQTLYALRESAPDEENRARAADALASLQAVRSAMDAERAPGAPARSTPRSSAPAADVRGIPARAPWPGTAAALTQADRCFTRTG